MIVAGASGLRRRARGRARAGATRASSSSPRPRAARPARALDRLYPRYRVPIELTELDLELLEEGDAAIVAYPHGAAAPVVAEMRGLGIQVVDLSADFRLVDAADLRALVRRRTASPSCSTTPSTGSPSSTATRIRDAELVANPGCYPTAALLALAPLAERGLIDVGDRRREVGRLRGRARRRASGSRSST